jgi:hypothetical protein
MSDDQTKRPTEDDEQPTGCTPEMLEWATALLEKERHRRDELLERLGDVLGKVFDSDVTKGE